MLGGGSIATFVIQTIIKYVPGNMLYYWGRLPWRRQDSQISRISNIQIVYIRNKYAPKHIFIVPVGL
jgi:hypothetical protein